MTDFNADIAKAGLEAAYLITEDIQSHLISAGWPKAAARSVIISHDSSGFKFSLEGDGAKEASVIEYGSEYTRPSANIRKYLSSSGKPDAFLMKSLESYLGELV